MEGLGHVFPGRREGKFIIAYGIAGTSKEITANEGNIGDGGSRANDLNSLAYYRALC
jgi:hypothetical protein